LIILHQDLVLHHALNADHAEQLWTIAEQLVEL
jgi:hypothetical protein